MTAFAVLVAGVGGGALVTAPAQAAYPQTSFAVSSNIGPGASGNFIWYNRSVQVGGGVWGLYAEPGIVCAAVVFTAYDGNGRQVARAARPGDGVYHCAPERYGYGFTLDASSVVGGIRTIRVDLWEKYENDRVVNSDTAWYYRP